MPRGAGRTSRGRSGASTGSRRTWVLTVPLHIDTIEWFASARDLVAAMDWLQEAGGRKGLEPVREILAINPGIQLPASDFEYVDFKGGSEPGVLNGTFLLQTPSRAWFAVSASWNDPDREVDQARFFGLVQKACRLLARSSEE